MRYPLSYPALLSTLLTSLMISTLASAANPRALVIETDRNELRIEGVVQKNPKRPIHSDWGKKSTAFIGVREGSETKDFVIVLDADRKAIYDAARLQLGWQGGRTYNWYQTFTRRGLNRRTKMTDYMTGDPLLCILEFDRGEQTVRVPLENVIRSRIEIDDTWVEVPYTPHFVFTGAGEKNGIDSGCLVCPSDCVGGIMTDNSVPVMTENREYLVDWEQLPPPGTSVTVILRSIR